MSDLAGPMLVAYVATSRRPCAQHGAVAAAQQQHAWHGRQDSLERAQRVGVERLRDYRCVRVSACAIECVPPERRREQPGHIDAVRAIDAGIFQFRIQPCAAAHQVDRLLPREYPRARVLAVEPCSGVEALQLVPGEIHQHPSLEQLSTVLAGGRFDVVLAVSSASAPIEKLLADAPDPAILVSLDAQPKEGTLLKAVDKAVEQRDQNLRKMQTRTS